MISFSLKLEEYQSTSSPQSYFQTPRSLRVVFKPFDNKPSNRSAYQTKPRPENKSHKHKNTDRSPNPLPSHCIALYRAHPSHTSGQTPQADKAQRTTSPRSSPAYARPADREIISHTGPHTHPTTRRPSIDRLIFAASLTRAHNTSQIAHTRLFGTIRARQPTGVRMTGCMCVL